MTKDKTLSRRSIRLSLSLFISLTLASSAFADTPAEAPIAQPKVAPQATQTAKPAKAKPAQAIQVVKPVAKPVTKPVAKPVAKPVVKPVAKSAVKPLAAQIGATTLSIGELDQNIADQLKKARLEFEQKRYELRAQAVEQFLSEQALKTQVAQSKASTIPELLESEVFNKIKAVDDAAVEAFYQQNKERIGDRPAAEVKPMIKEYLSQQAKEEAARTYIMGLRKKYQGKSFLEPPRIKVAATGFSKGPQDAPITIVEFADYECGFCSRVLGTIDSVMKKYPGKVRVVYRDFPLNFHPNATNAAVAARCAGAQGKFWEMHTLLFQDQRGLTRDNFNKWAAELKLDAKLFTTCLDDPKVAAAVQVDLRDGSAAGVSGTPAFFINGVSLSGAQPLEAFIPIIDQELARLAQ